MKRKTDFVTVKFNENEPHTTQEWWVYWVDRYYSPAEKDKNALANFIKIKLRMD